MATTMKNLIYPLLAIVITTSAWAQKSPRENATGNINGTTITIDYGAPSVRNRVIWGELVPYDKVWRAGANENTTVSFDKDVTVGNNRVPTGKYGFFIFPNKNGKWTIVLNKRNNAWGAFTYDQKDDLMRVMIQPTFTSENQETLVYKVQNNGILMSWEKVRLFIPVK